MTTDKTLQGHASPKPKSACKISGLLFLILHINKC